MTTVAFFDTKPYDRACFERALGEARIQWQFHEFRLTSETAASADGAQAVSSVDARVLQTLASVGMKPEQFIAVAFQELAGKAEKIGQLNISPDLLRELLQNRK